MTLQPATYGAVHVSASGSYDVLIGEGLLDRLGSLVRDALPSADK